MIRNYQEEMSLEPAEPGNETIATVGEVFPDGITLIFAGQTKASLKRYKCSRFGSFAPGDTVKIFKCSGTYIVEYPIGNPR